MNVMPMPLQQHLTNEFNEQEVAHYLRKHPEFFLRHEDVLAVMRIPHKRGAAISLVERQVMVLRDENQQLLRKLNQLVEIAKRNENLNKRLQRVLLALLEARNPEQFFTSLYQTLAEEFHTDAVMLRLFEVSGTRLAERPEAAEYDAQVFQLFETVLEGNQPLCGRLSIEQHEYLFPGVKISSAVLIPLGSPHPNGLLALGSEDVTRFHSGMATDLLKYLGEMVSQLVQFWRGQ